MRRLVLDLAESRPVFEAPDWLPARVRAGLGSGWEVVDVGAPASGLADGATRASDAALEAVRSAEVYVGFGLPAALVRAAPALRWAHTGTAGVAGALTPALRESGVVLTNSAGVHGPAVAETVIAMILHFARGLDVAVRAQHAGEWDKRQFDAADTVAREVAGATVGVVGYGGIGREVGRRAAALGARVVGVRRDRPAGETTRQGGAKGEERAGHEPAGATVLHGRDGLDTALRESDYLVLAAPETDETRGMIDGAALERLKPSAVLVNVGRGALVVEDALVGALRAGRLRGAALDVFAREPLPAGHPFWTLPNVLITPHVASYTARFWQRQAELIEENIRRYLAGRPLLNVVDARRGY